MSFVTFVNGMLKFTLPPATECHIQVEWLGPGAKKMKIDGDPSQPVIYASCPPITIPPPPTKFEMLPTGGMTVHDVMVDPANSRAMKITPYHENGTPCPQMGGIDPNDKFTSAIEVWTHQDPNDPRKQASAWVMATWRGDTISTVIIVEPAGGGGATAKKLMKGKLFKQMNAHLSTVHKTLQVLLDMWSDDFSKIK
jgi:hypothetical protein